MAIKQLLNAVLSAEGLYCVVGLKKSSAPKQLFVQTIEEVEKEAAELLNKDYDAYFACAKYETNENRTTDNVKAIRAFWLDLDCGPGKPYPEQTDAAVALRKFCTDLSLPKPTLVSSGRGIHVYWCLTKDLTRLEWKPVAERLKQLCHERGLHADPSRTADAASILRLPGTSNFKTSPPLPVRVITAQKPVDFEAFRGKLGVSLEAQPSRPPSELSELTRMLIGNKQCLFSNIVTKISDGSGCAQLDKAIKEQETIEEPLWRAALSIAVHCSDSEAAIHEVSHKHPEYSASETEAKARRIKGPYTCESFAKINPAGCAGCPHSGKITSPIVLGQEVLAAAPEDNVITGTPNVAGSAAPATVQPATYTIPAYPFPYFRGKTGGVYRRGGDEDDEDGEEDAKLIYEHDLYVVKRLRDPQSGEVVWLRLHTPKDGVREFALPAVDLLTPDRLREKLAWYGIVAMKKQMDSVMAYIVAFVKELQCREGAEIMRTQFGWTDKNRSFIVGDTEICADGDRYSPPSSYTAPIADYFTPVGSLEKWKQVADVYGRPGFEPHAFGFFSAFGAPLLKHLGLKGAIINMINNESGTGKTTTLLLMHSVYSHPEEVMLIQRDTLNVRLHRLGVMNNLPIGVDEITKMKPDDFSDFAYAVSQGRGRGRMKSNENAERLNFAKWETIVPCSSNASAVEKLKTLKDTADGELMRLIEYTIPPVKLLSKEEAGGIFPLLHTNYGHAGRIYLRDLVCNLDERIREVKEMQVLIDKKIGFTNRERFWSGVAACNLAGALFARRLGLIDIDIGRVFRWLVKEFSQMRLDIKPPSTSHASIIGEFWNEQRHNTLVINDLADKRTGVEMLPIVEPRNELVIRMEPDTKKLFIASRKFRSYCAERQITVKDVLNSLTTDGVYLGTVKKRLSKGTKMNTVPAVDCYVFDCSKGDFIDPEAYIEAAKASQGQPQSDES